MNPLIQLKTPAPLFLVALLLACFGFVPLARAVLPAPSPDGGYPGGNTAEGTNALHALTTGLNNTAVGASALESNNTGGYNVAIGGLALAANTGGQQNMAIGAEALAHNISSFNLAIGFRVGFMNTTGTNLTGIGAAALRNNTTGNDNTAIGTQALFNNTNADRNTAIGSQSLTNNNATSNVAVGYQALLSNTTGAHNTACGISALDSNTSGGFNIAIGSFAGSNLTTGYNNIEIGSSGFPGEHNTIRISVANGIATFIDGIYGITAAGPTLPVYINSGGQLSTNTSSRRFKNEIKPMDGVSEAILALKPVTFHYKTDAKGTAQFGLIAEEVAEVNPDLVVRDKEGKPYSVRYDQVNAMLLNEFLKEHKTVEEQGATIARQQKQIEALTAGLQKVSAQLEVSKPAPQTVLNAQ
jgi:hypothetical protein